MGIVLSRIRLKPEIVVQKSFVGFVKHVWFQLWSLKEIFSVLDGSTTLVGLGSLNSK